MKPLVQTPASLIAATVALIFPVLSYADTFFRITDLNWATFPGWNVTGSITTDGVTGPLAASDIKSFDLTVVGTYQGFLYSGSIISFGGGGLDYAGGFSVSGSNLEFAFSSQASYALFHGPPILGGRTPLTLWQLGPDDDAIQASRPTGQGNYSFVAFGAPLPLATDVIGTSSSVPEPATLGLVLLSLTGVLGFARRRRTN
jgi:hypothetical protein